ncbi:porin [Vibrio lentus]|uniref:Porin n=2 Tax=Vibrio lentus TaxID=136468 RepID=A0A2N7IPM1_9VIBR|nr:carbohydrate porin [Vibrio lentus]PMJ80470.1 porin [Vibrio lentus]PML60206.1 porin [Vibrio lentus]PMM22953.1 porin [Vibrio lentus]PMN39585.1 porin [Vibrio lentus]PMN55984.1 porin [Vibrio lentus]
MAVMVAATSLSPAVYSANFEGPDSVENTIAQQKDQQLNWREKLAADGFTFGADYFALGLTSGDGVGGDSVDASSGVARLYGSWHLLGNGTQNSGSLVWKVEHRHAYGNTSPKEFGFIGSDQIGYVGLIAPAFSDQGFRVTDLNWKQKINDGKGTIIVGWQDVTNYADVYALASPWSGFTNLAFSTGSGAMGLPDDGVLALSAGHMLGENFYVVGGIADAKGKSDDIFDGFDTAFGSDASYFTTLELGWTASQEQIYTDNFHVTFWDFGDDTRHNLAYPDPNNTDGGRGINFSWSQFLTPQVMPFVRGGVSEGQVALYDKSLSVGFGYFGLGQPTNNLGVAVNWSELNEEILQPAANSDEQWTAEIYYNMQFGDHLQVTPDIQYIKDPAFSSESSAWVFGIRARVFI